MNKLHTGTYWLDIRSFDNEVAHLYEHMLIQTFINRLTGQGISRYLFGWIDGETFNDVLFISYNFYLPSVEQLFINFITHEHRVDMTLYNLELERLQAETQAVATCDKSQVLSRIRAIDQATFTNITDITDPYYFPINQSPVTSVIELKPDESLFERVMVTYYVDNLSIVEKVVFLRIAPILSEAISEILHAAGAYTIDGGAFDDDQQTDSMARLPVLYTIKKGTADSKQLQTMLTHAIKQLPNHVLENAEQVRHYIHVFESDPAWIDAPIEYYRNSGLLTSRSVIAQSFTPESVAEIISRVVVAIET